MKNKILKITVTIAAVLAAITICMIDSNRIAITATCFASVVYLLIFAYANYGDWDDKTGKHGGRG